MALIISQKLIRELKAEKISYCHWKSNQHLDEALSGFTDIDLLVKSEQAQECEEILKKLAFIKIISSKNNYPGIEDWLGFDHDTGRLIHLHLHYSLVIGEKDIKNIKLPLENWLIDNATVYKNVNVPACECELMLLIIRSILKIDSYDILRAILKGRLILLSAGICKEFNWLLDRWNTAKLSVLVKESGLPFKESTFLEFIERYKKNQLDIIYLVKVKAMLMKKLKPYARFSRGRHLFLKTLTLVKTFPLFKQFKTNNKKRLVSKTLFLAFIGADGSGKTRLIIDLKRCYAWKLEVKHIYFGIPKKQLFRKCIKKTIFAANVLRHLSFRMRIRFMDGLIKSFTTVLESLFWLHLARVRYLKYNKAMNLAKKGCLVVAERYPLEEFNSMEKPMDGPRIPNNLNRLLDRLAKLELGYYRKIFTPDMLFILKADINTLRNRIQDLDFSTHLDKCKAVNDLNVKDNYYLINAEADYNTVLLKVKQLIWSYLRDNDKKTGVEINEVD